MPKEKKPTKEKPKSSMLTWIIVGATVLVLGCGCVVCGGVGAWFVWKPSSGNIDGAWEYAGGAVPRNLRSVKLQAGGLMVNTLYDRDRRTMVLLSGGTYTLSGSTYKERIEFCSAGIQEMLLGKEQTFTVGLQNDRVHVTGVLSNGNPIDESWQRLASVTPTAAHEGAWENVSPGLNPNVRSVKLIIGNQYVTVAHDRARKVVVLLAGGKCTATDKAITETADYCSAGQEKLLGQPQAWTIDVRGDQMSVSGTIAGAKVSENWKRIK